MATQTVTASEVIEQILEHGIRHADDTVKEPNLIANDAPSAQGDVYIWKIDSLEDVPEVEKCDPVLQLAPGNTRGSRHCLDPKSIENATFYKLCRPNALQGPLWENPDVTVVTHPEHGDQLLAPGLYYVSYQREHAEELKRIAD